MHPLLKKNLNLPLCNQLNIKNWSLDNFKKYMTSTMSCIPEPQIQSHDIGQLIRFLTAVNCLLHGYPIPKLNKDSICLGLLALGKELS